MVRIRKTNYYDKFKLKKMISFLSSDVINYYTKTFMNTPINFFHDFLPYRFKFLPESYVIEENKDIIGMVTVSPTAGNPFRLIISRLFLEHDYFNSGKQLVDFVVAKYGAKGVSSFLSIIDDSSTELLHLFIDGCGFRHCSSEQLWRLETIRLSNPGNTFFRPFKDSDAQSAAMLFNDSIITHFKYSISRAKDEYIEPFFNGLNDDYKLKFVAEDENSKALKAYFSITTSDNVNYILNITNSLWYECQFEDVLSFAVKQIAKRKKDFSLFVRVRKYTTTAESLEKFLLEKGANCIQNQAVLVKDFYKIIKEPQQARKIVLFNEISKKPVFKSCE